MQLNKKYVKKEWNEKIKKNNQIRKELNNVQDNMKLSKKRIQE